MNCRADLSECEPLHYTPKQRHDYPKQLSLGHLKDHGRDTAKIPAAIYEDKLFQSQRAAMVLLEWGGTTLRNSASNNDPDKKNNAAISRLYCALGKIDQKNVKVTRM